MCAVVATLATMPALAIVVACAPGPGLRFVSFAARILLCALGIRLETRGRPPSSPALVVAEHTSWLDAVVFAAVAPGAFVARADLVDPPGGRLLARCIPIVPLERERLRALPHAVDAATRHLRAGRRVVVFPEGTTSCSPTRNTRGRCAVRSADTEPGRFRPAFFQAAVDAGCPVAPVELGYRDRGGPTTIAAFVGDDLLPASIERVLHARGLVATVRFLPVQGSGPAVTRRQLAARAERTVCGLPDAAPEPPRRVLAAAGARVG